MTNEWNDDFYIKKDLAEEYQDQDVTAKTLLSPEEIASLGIDDETLINFTVRGIVECHANQTK